MTPGDPLSGGAPEPERKPRREREPEARHASGLPSPEAPAAPGGSGWSVPEAAAAPVPAPSHYASPPPPGAGGGIPTAFAPGAGQLVLAGWWRRAFAALIDGVIIGAVAFAIMAVLGIGAFSVDSTAGFVAIGVAIFVAALVLAVVSLLYAPFLMDRTNGQTLGRMATGIRVVRTDGAPMTFSWAMLREVAMKWLVIGGFGSALTFGIAPLLDILWPLWDEENRALHDFPVQTRTVLA